MRRLLPAVLLLAACSKPAPEAPAAPPAKAGVEIVFRHGAVPGFERYLHHLYNEFTKKHPNVRIRDEVLPNNSGTQHQLYAINLEGGSDAFDLMAMDIVWIAEFARAGWTLDLTPYFGEEERRAFLPSTVEASTYDGRLFAVPWFTDAGLLYYRKDLLAAHGHEPPETWDDLVRIAKDVVGKEKERNPRLVGYVWQGKQYEGLVCDAVEVLASNGVRFLDEKGRWAVDRGKAVRALRFMAGLIHRHEVSPMLVLAAEEETARQIFGNGDAVFMRNWPYAYGIFSKPESPIRGRFGIRPLPHFKGGRSVGTLGGWYLGVNRSSRHPREAYEFARYMTSEEVQRDVFKRLSYLPTRRALYEDRSLLSSAPQLKEFGRILLRTQPRPVTPYYMGVSEILQAELSAALAGLKTPEKALDAVAIQIEPILGTAPRQESSEY